LLIFFFKKKDNNILVTWTRRPDKSNGGISVWANFQKSMDKKRLNLSRPTVSTAMFGMHVEALEGSVTPEQLVKGKTVIRICI